MASDFGKLCSKCHNCRHVSGFLTRLDWLKPRATIDFRARFPLNAAKALAEIVPVQTQVREATE